VNRAIEANPASESVNAGIRINKKALPKQIEPQGEQAVDQVKSRDMRGRREPHRKAPAQRQPVELHREYHLQDDREPETRRSPIRPR